MIFIFVLFFEGPKLPKTLYGHECVTQGNELIVIGGESDSGVYSSDLFKLKFENKNNKHLNLTSFIFFRPKLNL